MSESDDERAREAHFTKMVSAAKVAVTGAVTIPDMIPFLGDKSAMIEVNQMAWLKAGLYSEPDPKAMEEVAMFDAIRAFLVACEEKPEKVAARLMSRAKVR